MLDVIIIGGGPIGLYSAAQLQKKGFTFSLLEASSFLGGQTMELYPEKEIVDIPGIPSIKSKDYIDSLTENIDKENIYFGTVVSSFVHQDNCIRVMTNRGFFEAQNLFICTGLGLYKPRTMGLEGEEKYSNILYSLKSFGFLSGKRVVIFGGGDSALDWAKEISQISPFVSLVHRRTEFRGNSETIKGRAVKLYLPYIPHSIIAKDGKCVGITIEGVEDHDLITIPADFILVNYGSVPLPSLFGLKSGPTFGALVNERREAEPHVFAIGDCSSYEGKVKRIAHGMDDADRAIKTLDEAK